MSYINYDTKKLSTARTTIMGFAMMMVVFFHSSLNIESFWPYQTIKNSGDIAVDIFFFVAGIGIFYSLNKHSSKKEYIIKRLLRILPAYLIVDGLWFVLQDIILSQGDFTNFILDVTSLNFWINGRPTTWYLSALLLLQLLTPFYKKASEKYSKLKWIVILGLFAIGLTIRLTPFLDDLFDHLLIIIFRAPCYFIGFEFGKMVHNGENIKINKAVISIVPIISILVILTAYGIFKIYIPWSFKYIAYCPLAIILSILLSNVKENRLTNFLGKNSLEIYLIHEKVLWAVSIIADKLLPTNILVNITVNIVSVLIACIAANILHKLISLAIKKR